MGLGTANQSALSQLSLATLLSDLLKTSSPVFKVNLPMLSMLKLKHPAWSCDFKLKPNNVSAENLSLTKFTLLDQLVRRYVVN